MLQTNTKQFDANLLPAKTNLIVVERYQAVALASITSRTPYSSPSHRASYKVQMGTSSIAPSLAEYSWANEPSPNDDIPIDALAFLQAWTTTPAESDAIAVDKMKAHVLDVWRECKEKVRISRRHSKADKRV